MLAFTSFEVFCSRSPIHSVQRSVNSVELNRRSMTASRLPSLESARKRADVIRRRYPPRQVEIDAPQKFFIGRQRRGRNSQSGQLAENFLVNEVALRNCPVGD